MANLVKIMLPCDTDLLESILETLPEAFNSQIKVIMVSPSSFNNHCYRPAAREKLYTKAKAVQARVQSQYPSVSFCYLAPPNEQVADNIKKSPPQAFAIPL